MNNKVNQVLTPQNFFLKLFECDYIVMGYNNITEFI